MADHTTQIAEQLNKSIHLLQSVLGPHLLGVYLYGSAVLGGLQKYSDLDLFVVSERATDRKEKELLVNSLLQISGVYMKSSKLPLELTLVVKSEVNPWHYPPCFDFQYGDWLREPFENGIIEPWPNKVMPDLALLITQVLLANKVLFGPSPDRLLCPIPYRDFILAIKSALPNLIQDLATDRRNVLLTCARIWNTLKTDTIRSKPAAARWAMQHLPTDYQPVLEHARSICLGETSESWSRLEPLSQACACFMISQIKEQLLLLENTEYADRLISLDNTP
jgi:predicted nucleotidyltransferase